MGYSNGSRSEYNNDTARTIFCQRFKKYNTLDNKNEFKNRLEKIIIPILVPESQFIWRLE